jgi:hypothetical protein
MSSVPNPPHEPLRIDHPRVRQNSRSLAAINFTNRKIEATRRLPSGKSHYERRLLTGTSDNDYRPMNLAAGPVLLETDVHAERTLPDFAFAIEWRTITPIEPLLCLSIDLTLAPYAFNRTTIA